MQLEVVNIEDVYPDENNPRQRFDGIEELAESFDLNTERPGEPFTPPILVRDGGIYRIVDGERRYKALKLRRKRSFTANVCESMDEANMLMAMLATDDKQPLSDVERSRGVQQMLLLGVDPVKVDKVTRGRSAKRIKRAMGTAKDAGEDMSLDRLLAIDEFEQAGNEHAVRALMVCREDEWERIAIDERQTAKLRAKHDEIKQKLIDADIPLIGSMDEKPEGYVFQYTIYGEGIDKLIEDKKHSHKDIIAMFVHDEDIATSVYVFQRRYEQELTPEQERRRMDEDKVKADIKAMANRMGKWLAGHLDNLDSIPYVTEISMEGFNDANSRDLDEFANEYEVNLDCKPCKLAVIVGYQEFRWKNMDFFADLVIAGNVRSFIDLATRQHRLIQAFVDDGYELDESEQAIFDALGKGVMDNA